MIVTKITDGLGNQMFQYACGFSVSKRLNTTLMLDTAELTTNEERKYELNKFNIRYDKLLTVHKNPCKFITVLERKIKRAFLTRKVCFYTEKRKFEYDKDIEKVSDNTYLIGYWQSDRYFREYRLELMKIFRLAFEPSPQCKKYLEEVSSRNSVAVHIRRGDYKNIGVCIGSEYYNSAINIINNYVDKPLFYVFSDDIFAAEELLADVNGNFNYVQCDTENATLEEMAIMRSCKHQIIANSTYSWWAAWLNDNDTKVVICPEYKYWTGEFYPDDWIKLKLD